MIVENPSNGLEHAKAAKIGDMFAPNFAVSPAWQEKIYRNGTLKDKVALAKSSNLPSYLQINLAQEKDAEVRRALAHNETLNTTTQYILSTDRDKDVRVALFENPSIDPRTRKYLMQAMKAP